MHHYFNNGLKLNILGKRWANGPQPGLTEEETRRGLPANWIVAHASWTHNHENKPVKLRSFGEWDARCVERLQLGQIGLSTSEHTSNETRHLAMPVAHTREAGETLFEEVLVL